MRPKSNPQPPVPSGNAPAWAFALFATAVAAGLHVVFFLSAGALWRDEINSVEIALLPSPAEIWSMLRYDSFPFLPALVLRTWSAAIGTSDLAYRFYGFCVGLGLLGTAWLNARWLYGRPPCLSLVLFAIAPIVIRFGDSVRPHGLGTLLIALLLGLVWKAASTGGWRWLAAATATAVLCVQCLYTNALLVGAVCVSGMAAALIAGQRRRAMLLLGVGATAAVSLLPYVSRLQAARDWMHIIQAPLTVDGVWVVIDDALSSFAYGTAGDVQEILWLLGLVVAVPIGIRRAFGQPGRAGDSTVYLTVVVVAATLAYVGFVLTGTPTQPWYYLPWMAVVAPALDGLLVQSALWPRMRVIPMVVLGGLLLLLIPAATDYLRRPLTNIDHVAAFLEKEAKPEDLIVLPAWFHGISFQRYYHGATPWTTVPPFDDLRVHRYDLLKEKMTQAQPLQPVLDAIDKTMASGHRVWMVGIPAVAQNRQAPPPLAPAPDGPAGWDHAGYIAYWQYQVGTHVWLRSNGFARVVFPGDAIQNGLEDPPLFVTKGQGPPNR